MSELTSPRFAMVGSSDAACEGDACLLPAAVAEPETTTTRRSYDRVAHRYAAEIGGELPHKPGDRALLDTVADASAGGIVVDLGCGPGHVTAYLAGRGARALGFDLSPVMCAVARRATSLPFATADMTALPIRSDSVAALVCWYAVIHLDVAGRAAAYREFARVLRPGGYASVAFHTGDVAVPTGGASTLTSWWGHDVELTFRFLDPGAEVEALAEAGLDLVGQVDRAPIPAAEHPSRRSYLLLRRP